MQKTKENVQKTSTKNKKSKKRTNPRKGEKKKSRKAQFLKHTELEIHIQREKGKKKFTESRKKFITLQCLGEKIGKTQKGKWKDKREERERAMNGEEEEGKTSEELRK